MPQHEWIGYFWIFILLIASTDLLQPGTILGKADWEECDVWDESSDRAFMFPAVEKGVKGTMCCDLLVPFAKECGWCML